MRAFIPVAAVSASLATAALLAALGGCGGGYGSATPLFAGAGGLVDGTYTVHIVKPESQATGGVDFNDTGNVTRNAASVAWTVAGTVVTGDIFDGDGAAETGTLAKDTNGLLTFTFVDGAVTTKFQALPSINAQSFLVGTTDLVGVGANRYVVGQRGVANFTPQAVPVAATFANKTFTVTVKRVGLADEPRTFTTQVGANTTENAKDGATNGTILIDGDHVVFKFGTLNYAGQSNAAGSSIIGGTVIDVTNGTNAGSWTATIGGVGFAKATPISNN